MDDASVAHQEGRDHASGESEPGTASEQPAQLPKDTLFSILENERRRDALRYLRRNGGSATLSDLAENIAAKENGVDVAALASDERKRVYIALYQCHLPKMATAGVVDFDKNRGEIELRAAAEQLDPYLGDEGDATADPTRRNLVVAGVIAVGLLASVAGVPGFALVPDAVWAAVSVAALVVLTLVDAR